MIGKSSANNRLFVSLIIYARTRNRAKNMGNMILNKMNRTHQT